MIGTVMRYFFFILVAGVLAYGGYRMFYNVPSKASPSEQTKKEIGKKEAGKKEEGEKEEHAGDVKLSDEKVKAAGIELLKAESGVLRDSFLLNGIVQSNQESLVQVTPRFPGIVRDI